MKHLSLILTLFVTLVSNAQSLTSISPASGVAGTTVNVTIIGNGTNFTNNTQFSLNQGINIIPLTNIVAISATRVTASVVIPSNAVSGTYALTAIVGLALPLRLQDAFTVTGGGAAASIQSINPTEGDQGKFLPVTITGVNTQFTQASDITATLVRGIGNNWPISVFPANDTTLEGGVFIPQTAEPGMYNLVVNTGTSILNKSNAFEVKAVDFGEIADVSPSEGEKGQTLDLTISFSRTKWTESFFIYVDFSSDNGGYFEGFNIRVINDTTLKVTVVLDNTVRIGSYDVWVGSNQVNLSAANLFSVTGDPNSEPRLVELGPNYGNPGKKLDITLTGVNTRFTQGSDIILGIFNQSTFVEASSFNAINDSTMILTLDIPSDIPLGTYDFGYVSDLDGYLELKEAFYVVVTSVKEWINELSQLFVYPNPVENELHFSSEETLKSVIIKDLSGKQIVIPLEEVKETTANTYSIVLDKYAVSKGIHFLRVETIQGVRYQKFLVQ
ncbi:MAG: T9SS type A sorting domain-containing protein [Bacteroidia bacterium]|jgi:hypothetical protein|nr:T9SS type A sorting domain-containing protein [Bacteroidia bacterium]